MRNPELTRRAVMGADVNEHEEKVAEAARAARRMTGKARGGEADDDRKSDLDVALRAARRVRDPSFPGV